MQRADAMVWLCVFWAGVVMFFIGFADEAAAAAYAEGKAALVK